MAPTDPARSAGRRDPLTGLPDRTALALRLRRTLARSRRRGQHCAVLFLDLDRFKQVNDRLGHLVGDLLLVAVARRLESCLRPGDTVARLGGDEFAVLLGVTDVEDAAGVAERILAALRPGIEVEGEIVEVRASLGIAVSGSGERDAVDLLREADQAMYAAKRLGRGRAELFDSALRERSRAREETERDLRAALEHGGLRLHFQPVVELPGGALAGLVALLRWDHPRRGLLRPAEFLPLAEESRLPITLWGLGEACRALARLRRGGLDLPWVSVRLAPQELLAPLLVDRIAEELSGSGLRGADLRLEIDDQAARQAADALSALGERLRALGVRVHLGRLGRRGLVLVCPPGLPVEAIKLDRRLTSRAGLDPAANALARAALAAGRELGLQRIAVGVETPAQAWLLASLGATGGQGSLYAEPLPEEALVQRFGPARRQLA